jgi:intraflagellar transport protein 172
VHRYDAAAIDRVSNFPIRGDIVQVERVDGATNVIVVEAGQQVAYTLDETLIEFGTALDDMDLSRAVAYLEQLPPTGSGGDADTQAMWRQLATVAVENQVLPVAKRYGRAPHSGCTSILQCVCGVGRRCAGDVSG